MTADSDQAPEEGDGGILSGLLAPLRLPEQVSKALDSLAAASEHLGPMRSDIARVREQTEPVAELPPLVERISEQAEPLAELLPALERVEQGLGERVDHLERELAKRLEPVAELLPSLVSLEESIGKRVDDLHQVVVALEGDESHLNKTVAGLAEEIVAMHKTVEALQDDVQSVTDRLPDSSQGPLAKARDVLTGGADQ